MQTIPLKNKTIDLPNSWSDLNEKQALFVFKKLSLLFAGQIEPIQFQFELLRYFTGYNPKHQKKIRSLEVGITGLMYQLFYGKNITKICSIPNAKFKRISHITLFNFRKK